MKLFPILALVIFSQTAVAQSPSQWGSYPNRPLALQDLVPPNGRGFSLIHDFNYIDQNSRVWEAPTGLIVDGASIPFPFWSTIGGPFEGLYREASIVHDAGCCAQMQTWQDVHHMFYNAMRCSGVSWAKAKTMFYAVWFGGPRWTHLNTSIPAKCKIAPSPGGPSGFVQFVGDLRPEISRKLEQEIATRTLSAPEARAVARPFFTRGQMTDKDAIAFVSELKSKKRELKPEEQQLIAISVIQSELMSDGEVKETEQWIKKENPSLELIESKAEEKRGQKLAEPRLFPQIRELMEPFKQPE